MSFEAYGSQLVEFVRMHQVWAAPVVFALCFAESLAFISLLVPAWAALVGIGALISAGGLNFWPIWIAGSIGAALGDWNAISPRKNHPESFEAAPYILGTSGGHVQFAYGGWYKNLVRDRISIEDVVWASRLLGRLSDKQWQDAFRAGGYEPAVANRFIAKLRKRVEPDPANPTIIETVRGVGYRHRP